MKKFLPLLVSTLAAAMPGNTSSPSTLGTLSYSSLPIVLPRLGGGRRPRPKNRTSKRRLRQIANASRRRNRNRWTGAPTRPGHWIATNRSHNWVGLFHVLPTPPDEFKLGGFGVQAQRHSWRRPSSVLAMRLNGWVAWKPLGKGGVR